MNALDRILQFTADLGPVLSVIAAIGFAYTMYRLFSDHPPAKIWAVLAAYVLSVAAIHVFLPESFTTRHIFQATPVLALFTVAGVQFLATRLPSDRAWGGALYVAAIVVFLMQSFRSMEKPDTPFSELAERMIAGGDLDSRVLLLSTSGFGEGPLTAEIAMRRPNPSAVVLRGTKFLSRTSWSGRTSEPLYRTPAEIVELLGSVPVDIVVLDDYSPVQNYAHHRLLTEAVVGSPDRWRNVFTQNDIRVFGATREPNAGRSPIRIDMRRRLGKIITLKP